MSLTPFRLIVLSACWLLVLSPPARAQDLSATKEAVAIPPEVAEPIKAMLQTDAMVVMRGENRLEFWWVRSLPLESAPSDKPAWANVADGALLGVFRMAMAMSDVRGLPMKPGVYTLRFALQPQDGDHMGVSPNREFLLVAPVGDDQAPEPAGFKGAVALAKKTLGKSHPATLSVNPPATDQPAGAVVTTDEGHKGIATALPVTVQGKPAGTLSFGLTLVGQYEH